MTLKAEPVPDTLIQKLEVSSQKVVTVSINTLYKLATPSTIWTIEECFGEYTLCDETSCQQEIKFAGILSIQNPKVSSGTLTIVLNNPLPPLNAFIGIMQPNRSFLKIPIYLEVCGYETISPLIYLSKITKTNLIAPTTDFSIELS